MIERHCHHQVILPRLAMILGLLLGCAHGTAQDGGAFAAPTTQPAAALEIEDVIGVWKMHTKFRGSEVPAVMTLWVENGKLAGVWESSERVMPLTSVRIEDGRLKFIRQLGTRALDFAGTVQDDRIDGAYMIVGNAMPSQGTRTSAVPPNHDDRPRPAMDPTSREALLAQIDLSDPKVDLDKLLPGGVPRDGIPALVDPARMPARDTTYPPADARVAVVEIAGEAVAYPINVLAWHEIINDTLAREPIVVIYCPLCDSVSVMKRWVTRPNGDRLVLEFGVSGLLYNSNVVMYDRNTMGLWSQVYCQAMTGMLAGTTLPHLPVRVTTMAAFRAAYPAGSVLDVETGYDRKYGEHPFADYLTSDRVFRNEDFGYGTALPPKTLGLGVRAGVFTAFVPADAAREQPVTVTTPAGNVVVRANDAGIEVVSVPESVQTVQTFYHSWSAFHPRTTIVPPVEPDGEVPGTTR